MTPFECPCTPLPDKATDLQVNGRWRPVRNTLGGLIHPTVEGVRNFWRWYGDSGVLSADGRPAVLYHGTNAEFDSFDPEAARETPGVVFFASDPRVASAFALYRTVWGGAQVMPVYARSRTLLDVQGDFQPIREVEDRAHFSDLRRGETVRAYAQRTGFDGLVFRQVRDDVGPNLVPVADVYALFPSVELKSVLGNSGLFTPGSMSLSDALDETPSDVRILASHSQNSSGHVPT